MHFSILAYHVKTITVFNKALMVLWTIDNMQQTTIKWRNKEEVFRVIAFIDCKDK